MNYVIGETFVQDCHILNYMSAQHIYLGYMGEMFQIINQWYFLKLYMVNFDGSLSPRNLTHKQWIRAFHM